MTDYKHLTRQLQLFAESEPHYMPLLANASAILMENLADINWAGFYLMENGSLLLGPFQGKSACIRIQLGKGVCGTSVSERKTLRVEDVHKFPGHIACDSASNSEIVIPIFIEDEVVGVLDIDSPLFNRFTEEDQTGLEEFVRTLEKVIDFKFK